MAETGVGVTTELPEPLRLPASPWPVLFLIDTSNSMWYRRELVAERLLFALHQDSSFPLDALFEFRSLDAPSIIPTLCSEPRQPLTLHDLRAAVRSLSLEESYDFVSNEFSNASRTMPSWYLLDYLTRFATFVAAREMSVWVIIDGPDASEQFAGRPISENLDQLNELAAAKGMRVQWNAIAERDQYGTDLLDPDCYADASDLPSIAESSGGLHIRFCRDRDWTTPIVDSVWAHYLQPLETELPLGLVGEDIEISLQEGDTIVPACEVQSLPITREIPSCTPFTRDSRVLTFRAVDLLDVTAATVTRVSR